ncbi:hypothetical protein BSKO_04713 [Bryopsis sp. KO-2023]|nr:hypothetical protein BSKO_04713 [Bryopsis sp. KO-2023]
MTRAASWALCNLVVAAVLLSCSVSGELYEETIGSVSGQTRELLSEKEPGRIFSREKITRDLAAGQVYFACSTPGSLAIKNCMKYEYMSEEPIITFVANRTLYETSRDEGYADLEFFTYESIEKNSICVGPECSKVLDFGEDKDWCLVFVNSAVPSLNYYKVEEEPTLFTYSFNTCISRSDLPMFAAQIATLVVTVSVGIGLCVVWLFLYKRQGPVAETPRKGDYERLLPSPKFVTGPGSPLAVFGQKLKIVST